MAGYSPPPAAPGDQRRAGGYGGNMATNGKPTSEKTKSVSYKEGNSDQIYSLAETTAADAPSVSMPRAIEVINSGNLPIMVMVGYKTYSDETTIGDSGVTRYVHYMLMAGESYFPPTRGVIMNATDASVTQFDGTVVDNAAPNSNMYADISTVANAAFDVTTDPVSFDVADGDLWRVGDMMRCQAEVVEITAISGDTVTVKRGMLGTSAAAHGDGETIRLQFSNDYYDINKYSVPQTDASGRFKCSNLFGVGRGAATAAVGLVPGSLSIKFYSPGFQKLGMSSVTSSTNTGLTVSTEYGFDISVDGAGINSDNMKFTTDSSNVNWGGTNGVMSKIQEVLDEQFYTTASPINGKKAVIGIENGDIVFRSGQSLSSSAMLLAAPSGGETTPFGVGAIPAIGDISSPVAARLDADVIYDNVTNAAIPNSSVFACDDGFGRLSGKCSGRINYESGAINMIGCPPNAEFVYSVAHSSAFSGKLGTATTDVGGTLTDILVNTPNNKWSGSVTLKEYA